MHDLIFVVHANTNPGHRAIIGEQCAGPLSDFWMKRKTRQLGRAPRPEHRLWLSYIGSVTAIIGLIVFFCQLSNATPMQWNVTPIIGAAIASFGNQIITTICVTCMSCSYTLFAVDASADLGQMPSTAIQPSPPPLEATLA